MFPASRRVDEEAESTEMDGVEHLGQYVYEMTQAKIASLKAGTETLPKVEEADDMVVGDEDDEDNEEDEEEVEDAVDDGIAVEEPTEAIQEDGE